MEYSLYDLNKSSNLNDLTLPTLIDKLNLIGFEVDDIFIEEFKTNPILNNIRLLIKIPSNREDLLNETFLKNELSNIFLFKLKNRWSSFKFSYLFLLKQNYQQSLNYQTIKINSELPNILVYKIEGTQLPNFKTPTWVKNKLIDAGLPVSMTIQDLITLVNFEWGQTLNLLSIKNNFETLKLEQLQNAIKWEGEESYLLDKGTIVLKNEQNKILSTLGIFTPLNVKIESLSKISIEGYVYDIHENFLKLNTINTRISLRFLRKSYLETFRFAFQRLLTLLKVLNVTELELKKYCNSTSGLELKPNRILKLHKKVLTQTLNIRVIDLTIFQKANLRLLCKTQNELYFQIPNFRKDLMREVDLIEEYSRFIGYKNFQEILPTKNLVYYRKNKKSIEFIKQYFLNHGFNEVVTNSIHELAKQKSFSVQINNPLNTDLICLRNNLLEKLIQVFETNSKANNQNINYFEIGRVFKNSNKKLIEQDKVAGIFQYTNVERTNNLSLQWFIAKGFIETFLYNFGYSNISYEEYQETNSYYHPRRTVYLKVNNRVLGKFGELNPLTVNLSGIKNSVYIFELNCIYLQNWKLESKILNYEEYSKYPIITKDLSFIISRDQKFSDIKDVIRNNSNNLKTVEFFDIYYEPNNLEFVNIGLRLEFQSKFQTLVTEVIEDELLTIKNELVTKFKVSFKS